MSGQNFAQEPFDALFKILLVGDSGVGKSSLLTRFTADQFEDNAVPTIGVDFKLKFFTIKEGPSAGKRIKLTIWDTAGQERFRTLTSSYYRGAQGIIYAYDVSRRETFESLSSVWMPEVDLYSTVEDAVKMVVGNKVDVENREVTKDEGREFAKQHGCLFVETSAKRNIAVQQAFEELVQKILETPSLLDQGPTGGKLPTARPQQQSVSCCS
jgi:Ras-related protein Rab-18